MYCKYCKLHNHYIDDCPEILCKKCKAHGHPHWKCGNTSLNRISSTENIKDKPKNTVAYNNPFSAFDSEDEIEESESEAESVSEEESSEEEEIIVKKDLSKEESSIFYFLRYKDYSWDYL